MHRAFKAILIFLAACAVAPAQPALVNFDDASSKVFRLDGGDVPMSSA